MPIYAYRCTACGHAQDVLQKMSDAVLTVCPACSASSFAKQLTAAGFQLKGSGWYVTDFRGGNSGTPKAVEGAETAAAAADKPAADKPAAPEKSAEKAADKTAADKRAADKRVGPTADKATPAAAPAPAAPAPSGGSGPAT